MISLYEEGIHLTNVSMMDHKIEDTEDRCLQSRTGDTDSSDRDTYTAIIPVS